MVNLEDYRQEADTIVPLSGINKMHHLQEVEPDPAQRVKDQGPGADQAACHNLKMRSNTTGYSVSEVGG